MKVKCSKCGHVADEVDFPKGRDFLQIEFISGCPAPGCDNSQSPGDASMRMFGGERPFEYVREPETSKVPLKRVIHDSTEAS